MIKPLIRLFAFFGKEVNEVRRQPRLVLSLMLGPFLILTLFGIGYQGEAPKLRTALVVSPERLSDPRLKDLEGRLGANFVIVSTGSDEQAAMDMLARREIAVVEILPPDLEDRVLNGEQSPVEFRYNEINPLNERWIQYLSYVQVNQLNQAVLTEAATKLQGEAGQTKSQLSDVRGQLDALNSGISEAKRAQAQGSLRSLRDSLGVLALSPLLASQGGDGSSPEQTRQHIEQLRQDIDVVDKSLADGTIDQQKARLDSMRQRIAELEATTDKFSTMRPESIVTPLQQRVVNTRGQALKLVTFYAPAVLALILQDIAITLGALSLVRERLLGALELFSVAPVSMTQVLLGKYLGYTLFLGIISAALVALLTLTPLAVPFLGSALAFIGLLLLFLIASLGVGFLLSALSTSDSQAVQFSMLMLLLSIFFSGFFLPLESFWEPVSYVGYILPITHAIKGFQSLMLEGAWPPDSVWIALSIIAVISFALTALVWRRQFRRIAA